MRPRGDVAPVEVGEFQAGLRDPQLPMPTLIGAKSSPQTRSFCSTGKSATSMPWSSDIEPSQSVHHATVRFSAK